MRNILIWGVIFFFGILITWMITKIAAKLQVTHEVKEKISLLKSLPIVSLDSSSYELPNSNTTVVILFNTTCEHCQYDAIELKKSIASFSQTSILMISSEPIQTIRTFAEQYGLSNQPTVNFTKINPSDVFETFGSISIPHIFIYNKDRKLIKEFKGETKIEAILKYIQ